MSRPSVLADEWRLADANERLLIARLRLELEPELANLTEKGKDFAHTTGDVLFTRVLRGKDGSVEQAASWYRRFLSLREKFGLDDIHKECEQNGTLWVSSAMPHYEEINKYYNTAFDEKTLRSPSGHLVWYEAIGDNRTKAMLADVPLEKILKFFFTLYERRLSVMDRLSREEGRMIRTLRIVDCEGVSFWQANNDRKKFESQHTGPVLYGTSIESIHLMFITNIPKQLFRFWEIVKNIMPPRLLARTRVFGPEYIQDKEYLSEVGLALNKQVVGANKSHSRDIAATGDPFEDYEGREQCIPAGCVMERILEVSPGQNVNWEFCMGKASEVSASNFGFFSRLATKFSGSEVMFNVNAVWTDKMPGQIQMLHAKVRSAGIENGDTAEFWVDGKLLDYVATAGVNVVAVDLQTRAILLAKAYATSAGGSNNDLISDIAALPMTCMVLLAVKGSGAEDLSPEAWDVLEDCGAVLKQGHWHKGYALVGTRGGVCIAEARGEDVVAEGEVPTMEMQRELIPSQSINAESGDQRGSVQVDRAGMVIVTWSNQGSYLANKLLANYKLSIE